MFKNGMYLVSNETDGTFAECFEPELMPLLKETIVLKGDATKKKLFERNLFRISCIEILAELYSIDDSTYEYDEIIDFLEIPELKENYDLEYFYQNIDFIESDFDKFILTFWFLTVNYNKDEGCSKFFNEVKITFFNEFSKVFIDRIRNENNTERTENALRFGLSNLMEYVIKTKFQDRVGDVLYTISSDIVLDENVSLCRLLQYVLDLEKDANPKFAGSIGDSILNSPQGQTALKLKLSETISLELYFDMFSKILQIEELWK